MDERFFWSVKNGILKKSHLFRCFTIKYKTNCQNRFRAKPRKVWNGEGFICLIYNLLKTS